MVYRIIWTPAALDRLTEILEWLTERSATAALRTVERIEQDVQILANHPYAGPPSKLRSEGGSRRLVSGDHIVYYDVEEADHAVVILTIRHGRQEPSGLD